MRRTNLPGHALRSEGKAYELGAADQDKWVRSRDNSSEGVALCQCGWVSGWLESDRQRRKAHAGHKDRRRIIAARLADFESETGGNA
jgi:hypothetical protein